MNTVLLALARPVAICLVAGGLRFLLDYQATGKVAPSLVDGGLLALETAASWLGVSGAASQITNVRAKIAAPQG